MVIIIVMKPGTKSLKPQWVMSLFHQSNKLLVTWEQKCFAHLDEMFTAGKLVTFIFELTPMEVG